STSRRRQKYASAYTCKRSAEPSVGLASDTSSSAASGPAPTGPAAIERQNRPWSSRRPGVGIEHLGFERARTVGFGNELLERRNAIVPLDQRRSRTEPPYGLAIDVPHRGWHGVVVGVDQMRSRVRMPGEVDLADAIEGQAYEVVVRREAMV